MTRPSRILIVDDEPFNVDYLEQELEHLGYETQSAFNGRDALEKVAHEAPDLILLDIMMPGIDGLTVCRLLKDDHKTRRIPIIIMTALNAFEDRVRGIEAGADDFLTKPVDDRELVARIKTSLRVKHAVDEEIGQLRKISDHLAKFVPDSVRSLIAANPDSPELEKREQDVSVLFVDITGYTRLSELMAAEVLNLMIERYFSAFLDCIHNVDGEISETSGDGLMAIFPDSDPNRHASKAVDTALTLLKKNEALNRDNSIQPLSVHIGVNSGPALVGSTRFEGRRGARWVFTADGPVINLAARLANLAKGGEIVAGEETVNRLADRYPVEALGPKQLKNITGPVEAFRLLGGPAKKARSRDVESAPSRHVPEPSAQRRLGVVMALAIEPSAGSDGGQFSAVRSLVSEHRGQMLGQLEGHRIAQFGSPTDAVDCALAILRRDGDDGVPVRIGLHLGHILAEGERITGDGVDLARHLMGRAEPGGLALSGRVRRNLALEPELRCEEIGTREVDGSIEPMPLYRVILPWAEGDDTSAETKKANRHAPERSLPHADDAQREAVADPGGDAGIPWPEDYRDLEAHIREAWQVEDEIYLNRKLSGKSGALVYAVDITCRDFKGQAILKLDRAPSAEWSEQDEAQRHQQASEAVPEFAAEHLPRVVHASSHAGQLGILTTIAGRGLEYAAPLLHCPYDQQLETVGQLSRELLDGWNCDYAFAKGMRWPQDLLGDWLGYRLDPTEGRIHGFLAADCGLKAETASFICEGRWYPNPLGYALAPTGTAGDIQLRAAAGHSHGDLHGLNILVRPLDAGGLAYYLIDLALYRPDAFLFYDHAYFELSYLLQSRGEVDWARWCALLRALDPRAQSRTRQAQTADDLGLVQLIQALRQQVFEWIEEHEPNRLSYLESQVLLARVAVGLNFVNKPLEAPERAKALLFAASELKAFLKLHAIDWDKQGATLDLPAGGGGG